MFGHDDKDDKTQASEEPMAAHQEQMVQPVSTTPPNEDLMGVPKTDDDADDVSSAPVPPSSNDNDSDDDIDKIVNEINSGSDEETHEKSAAAPADDSPAPASDQTPSELLNIKKSALQELSPLLDELDQTPEEKLNILMMTIQASDDQGLIPNAFEMAKKIDDRKQRAQAMLDIINEINYFTKNKA